MNQIRVNGKEIKTKTKVTFLGIIFDSRLTWEEHIKFIQEKCKKRLNLMRSLAGSDWRASKNCQLIVYRTLIRPILDYGSIAYDSAARTHKDHLQVIQNKTLRLCCGAFKSTAASALQVDCGEPPLALRRKKLQLEYATKIKLQKNHPNENLLQDHWTKHYGSFKSGEELWTVRLADTIEKINVKQSEQFQSPPYDQVDINMDTNFINERKMETPE